MRLASIDIGTNTILMLIADISVNGIHTVVKDEHFIARLGKGVDENGLIQKETFTRVRDILNRLKNIADLERVDHIVTSGTSALRDAKNRLEFIEFVKKQLSIDIRVLSGSEEARLTYLGAISDLSADKPVQEYAVLDIGGGSTELVLGKGKNIVSADSLDIGCVRLRERILKTSPPDSISLKNAVTLVREHLRMISPISPSSTLIGVAGTLTTLAAIDLKLTRFDRDIIHRHILNKASVKKIFSELEPLTVEQIKGYPQIHPERADILLSGIIILLEVLNKLKLNRIVVSNRGLRYGVLLDYAGNLAK